MDTGEGRFDGRVFTGRWQTADGSRSGAAVYTLQLDGSLSGTWTQNGLDGQGTETLTPNP